MALRIRDNPRNEAFWKNIGNGEADSIDRDRGLRSDIRRKLFWQFDFQPEIWAFLVERHNMRDAIHVPLNEVSTQASVSAQSALQIYRVVRLQIPEIGASDCFLQQMEGQPVT